MTLLVSSLGVCPYDLASEGEQNWVQILLQKYFKWLAIFPGLKETHLIVSSFSCGSLLGLKEGIGLGFKEGLPRNSAPPSSGCGVHGPDGSPFPLKSPAWHISRDFPGRPVVEVVAEEGAGPSDGKRKEVAAAGRSRQEWGTIFHWAILPSGVASLIVMGEGELLATQAIVFNMGSTDPWGSTDYV